MARLTAGGIEPTDLTAYIARLEAALATAFGADLNTAPETPQGQLAGVLAMVLAEGDELAVYVAAGLDLHLALGRQLDDYGTLFGLPRIAGERSSVTATLTGTSGTIVPAGSRVRTAAGAVFATTAAATIGTGGTVDVLCRSVDFGPIVAGVGELNRLVDAIAGWASVTNAAAAVLGRNRESDAEYRRRYQGEIAAHARDGLEAVRARVLGVDGATDALVRDNHTSASVTVQGIAIAAGAILVVADGGANADVAGAIADTRPIGTPTVGNITVQVPHPQGHNVPIRFRRVDPIPIQVAVSVTAGPTFPSDGLARMRSNLVAWVDGTWLPGAGMFDQGGIGIGETLDMNRLLSPLNAVPGHAITAVTATRVAGGAALGTPDLDQRYTLEASAITFTLS